MKSVILKVVKLLLLFKKKCESKRILTTFIFLLLIFFPELSNCQKQNNIWCFGDSSGIDFNDSLNPVSYTHLRAHETVLDLVCRLLLEKKKNYNN